MKHKRPLAFVGTILFLVLAVVFAFGYIYGVIICVAAALTALAKFSVKNKRDALLCGMAAVVAAAALGFYAIENSRNQKILQTYTGETVTLTAHVITSRDLDGLCLVTASVDQINAHDDSGFELSLFINDEYLEVGDQFTATVEFEGQNPYQDKLSLQAKLMELHGITRGKYKALAWTQTARNYLSNTILSQLPEQEGSLAAAALTGDKDAIPAALTRTLQQAGVTHILVVSGFHITLIIGLFYSLFDKLHINRYAAFGLLIAVIAACFVFFGGDASVARACIMCFIVYAGRVLLRRTDAYTSTSIAAIVILTLQPSAIKEASFLLSFGCCFALTVVYPPVERAIKKRMPSKHFFVSKLRSLLSALALSMTINVVTLPILILFGMPVSLVAPFTNVAVVWLAAVLVIAAFLMCVPVGAITGIFALVAGVSAKVIILVSQFFASFSLASVSTSPGYLKVWLVFCGILLAGYVLYRKDCNVRKWFVTMCMVMVLLTGTVSRLAFTYGKPTITLYRDSAVILQDNGRALLVIDKIDRKGIDYLMSYLNYRYVNDVAYVIIINDIGQAAERYMVEQLPESIIVAAYNTTTPNIDGEEHIRYIQRIEYFEVLTFLDGKIEIRAGDFTVLVGELDPELEVVAYDLVVQRNPQFASDGYYLIGGTAYPCDREIVIYFQKDGTTKTVME